MISCGTWRTTARLSGVSASRCPERRAAGKHGTRPVFTATPDAVLVLGLRRPAGDRRSGTETLPRPVAMGVRMTNEKSAESILTISPELPNLLAASASGAVIVVGGLAREAARGDVARRTALEVEWIETRGGGTRLIEAVVARVRNGSVAALVLVEGAMLHRHSRPLVAAARLARTPMAYAKKGAVRQVLQAFGEVERRLSGEHAA